LLAVSSVSGVHPPSSLFRTMLPPPDFARSICCTTGGVSPRLLPAPLCLPPLRAFRSRQVFFICFSDFEPRQFLPSGHRFTFLSFEGQANRCPFGAFFSSSSVSLIPAFLPKALDGGESPSPTQAGYIPFFLALATLCQHFLRSISFVVNLLSSLGQPTHARYGLVRVRLWSLLSGRLFLTFPIYPDWGPFVDAVLSQEYFHPPPSTDSVFGFIFHPHCRGFYGCFFSGSMFLVPPPQKLGLYFPGSAAEFPNRWEEIQSPPQTLAHCFFQSPPLFSLFFGFGEYLLPNFTAD